MSDALVTRIADAVAATIATGDFGEPIEPVRAYQPVYKLEDLDVLHVTVMPRACTSTRLSRAGSLYDAKIDVAIQKKLAAQGTDEQLDLMLKLTESIARYMTARALIDLDRKAAWIETVREPLFEPDHLAEMQQYTAVITLTYRADAAA